MVIIHTWLFPLMWLGYLAYWWATSTDVRATDQKELAGSRIMRLAAILGAIALLWLPAVPIPILRDRCLPPSEYWFWIGAGITATGFAFGIWARHHLGSNWSQAVTIKQGHELITSGPYRFVRHPIYSGLLAAFLGCAVARGEWRGLVAVGLVFAVLWRKLKLEEQWLASHFGEQYENYAGRVSALLPHLL